MNSFVVADSKGSRIHIRNPGAFVKKHLLDEFAAHQDITKGLNGVGVYFADSYCSRQKGPVEYTNELLRQYTSKGSDFKEFTPKHLSRIQHKLNKRPRERLNFSTPLKEFFKHFN